MGSFDLGIDKRNTAMDTKRGEFEDVFALGILGEQVAERLETIRRETVMALQDMKGNDERKQGDQSGQRSDKMEVRVKNRVRRGRR